MDYDVIARLNGWCPDEFGVEIAQIDTRYGSGYAKWWLRILDPDRFLARCGDGLPVRFPASVRPILRSGSVRASINHDGRVALFGGFPSRQSYQDKEAFLHHYAPSGGDTIQNELLYAALRNEDLDAQRAALRKAVERFFAGLWPRLPGHTTQ